MHPPRRAPREANRMGDDGQAHDSAALAVAAAAGAQ